MGERACLCGSTTCHHRKSRKPTHPGAYGSDHQEAARRLLATAPLICARCGLGPLPGDPWEAGHVEDIALVGPHTKLQREHRSCNRRAGAQTGAALKKLKAEVAAQRRIAETRRYLEGMTG